MNPISADFIIMILLLVGCIVNKSSLIWQVQISVIIKIRYLNCKNRGNPKSNDQTNGRLVRYTAREERRNSSVAGLGKGADRQPVRNHRDRMSHLDILSLLGVTECHSSVIDQEDEKKL